MASSYTFEKQLVMKERKFAKSISKDKIIYGREGDEEDTVVIRSFYPTSYKLFGVKGIENIRRCFDALLMLCNVKHDSLVG